MLVLPVENQVRELDAKLLLAAAAAERGFQVLLGSQTFVFMAMPDLPRSLFIAKSMRSVNDDTLALIRASGHEIVGWDEEALVRFESPEYYAWRYSPRTFRNISRLFCWGQDDAEFFAGYSGYRGAPIHITGNPRLDLLRPELRAYFDQSVARIRQAHGRFVLINTNFSFVNNHIGSLNLVRRGARGGQVYLSRTGRGLSLAFGIGMAAHQKSILDAFRTLLPLLSAEFAQTKFIVRPHPSENHDTWRRCVASLPNVEVIHDGNVVPWLIACLGLLHNGCTTAVEATVLGTPSISFRPRRAEMFDYQLPNALSHQGTTTGEMIKLVEALLANELSPGGPGPNSALLDRHLASTHGPLAVDRIMTVLTGTAHSKEIASVSASCGRAAARTAMRGRTLIQHVKMHIPGHRQNLCHHAHQFPPISAGELDSRIARYGSQLGRFAGVRATTLSPNIFSIMCT
ncbi:MAG: hypothetical protein IT495_15950 [Gammaproteobacteria bacterium]|nr:hypothetical protein [Gammaproteobacteria bacterium]